MSYCDSELLGKLTDDASREREAIAELHRNIRDCYLEGCYDFEACRLNDLEDIQLKRLRDMEDRGELCCELSKAYRNYLGEMEASDCDE